MGRLLSQLVLFVQLAPPGGLEECDQRCSVALGFRRGSIGGWTRLSGYLAHPIGSRPSDGPSSRWCAADRGAHRASAICGHVANELVPAQRELINRGHEREYVGGYLPGELIPLEVQRGERCEVRESLRYRAYELVPV